MIDKAARNRLAELIRSLASGIISNDEFEEAIPESEDKAISEVFFHGAWCLYSDMKECKLKGADSLSDDARSVVARWVLFLKTDIEYKWPSASFKEAFLKSISLGLFGQNTLDKWEEFGDINHWPFINAKEFNDAKSSKAYLGSV
jgi:hypothetical protein